VLGPDGEDDSTGSTEWEVHAAQYGKRILCTNALGFVWVEKYESVSAAEQVMHNISESYFAWEDSE
jgi:hypothetical protein